MPGPVTAVSVQLPLSSQGRVRAGQTRPDAHREACITCLTANIVKRRDGNQAAYGIRRRSTRPQVRERSLSTVEFGEDFRQLPNGDLNKSNYQVHLLP